jgi:endoglucanase
MESDAMKKAMCSLLVLALGACAGTGGETLGGSPVVSAPAPAAVVSAGRTYTPAPTAEARTGVRLPIGKCVNMGNHLEPPTEGGWGGRKIADDDFKIIKAAGFDSVRIPVRWSSHAQASAPFTIDPAFMARVKHVVGLAEAAGLGVVLNMHHYDELYADPDAHSARFAGLWKQVAAEFRNAGPKVWFELLNEPTNKLTHANLLAVLNPALAQVRATNRTRPVIIGGENWSGIPSLATLPMPDDPYVVPTFHTYDPFNFTHQGASWVNPSPPLGRTFGSAEDYAELDANLQKVRDYMTRTGRVPFIGEYGAIDHPQVPLSERLKYYETVTSAFASIGVQSCAWGYTNTFKLRDGNRWLPGMVEAIKTTTSL